LTLLGLWRRQDEARSEPSAARAVGHPAPEGARHSGIASDAAGAAPLLDVRDVHYAYAGYPTLVGVSLEVGEREAVCIIGPNGAGKTTLAKVIAGIEQPRRGCVFLDGRPVSRLRPSRMPREGIAIVLEGRHVFPEQSVRTNLELGAYWRRLPRRELDGEIERVYELFPDLRRFAQRPGAALSGGQQQMLCVGRALMGAPRIMILDEPSMGLSPKLAAELYDGLASLRDAGLAILLIEQNAQLAFEFCTRGYVLQHGRVVLHGKVDELRATDLVHRIYLGVERLADAAHEGG
jgi:ABC-type branched-subunit amino acid transport system ATPase component